MTEGSPRMTTTRAKVLRELLADPTRKRYGYELSDATGLGSGTIYPILECLQQWGWVEREWESVDASVEGRPARHYYRLSTEGAEQAALALTRAEAKTRRRRPFPHPLGDVA